MLHQMDDSWPRRAHFAHYMHTLRCTYSLTVHIDITRLQAAVREGGFKAYPAQIFLLARVVNQMPEMRMALAPGSVPAFYDVCHPAYTILNPTTETFCSIHTPWNPTFAAFYSAVCEDMARYAGSTELLPQPERPPNLFDVSSLPWLDFTAFNLNTFSEGTHLAPIFTLGRYTQGPGGETLLPLAVQLHHAAADGIHAGRFVGAVRALAAHPETWL